MPHDTAAALDREWSEHPLELAIAALPQAEGMNAPRTGRGAAALARLRIACLRERLDVLDGAAVRVEPLPSINARVLGTA